MINRKKILCVFFSISAYKRNHSTTTSCPTGYETSIPLDAELTATGWPVAHYGLGRLLLYLQRRYAPTGGILVTEAGAAFEDEDGSRGEGLVGLKVDFCTVVCTLQTKNG